MDGLNLAIVAALLHDLDRRSPAGCAIGLHIRFTSTRYMFLSYPKRWMDQYSALGLLVLDPTVHWGMNNTGWVRWRDLEKIDSHGVLERAKDYGIMNGVTISMLGHGSRSIASFARSDRDYEDSEVADLERILADLHEETACTETLSNDDLLALKDLSIRLTH